MNTPSEPDHHRAPPGQAFPRRCLSATLIALGLTGLAVAVYFSLEPLFALFTGVLFAIFLRGLSNLVSRYTPVRDPWSVLLVLLLLICLTGLAVWWISGPLAREYQQLQQRLPDAISKLEQKARAHGLLGASSTAPRHPSGSRNAMAPPDDSSVSSLSPSSERPEDPSSAAASPSASGEGRGEGSTHSITRQLTSNRKELLGGAVSAFRITLQSIIFLIVILFIGIYLAFSPVTYTDGFLLLVPSRHRALASATLAEIEHKLRAWLIGQFISMINVGALIGLGLWIAGIPVPLVLGFIAGALDIIPLFGPVIAAIPAALLGFTIDPLHAAYAVLVFVIANQLESHLILPLIQRMSVSLPPALTVAALLIMGSLFGFWGVLLAVPMTIILLVLAKTSSSLTSVNIRP